MKKYNVSIVICVSDDIRVKNMLESIKDNCEVVLVLNGANKEIKKIACNYKKNTKLDVKIINLKEKNLSKSRNIGVKKSKYDKVVFYDSDCIMTPNTIEKYDKMLDKYMLVDGNVKFKSDTFSSKIISVLREFGLPGYALCPSMGLNKKIINKIGFYFDNDIKWIEDSELNKRAKKEGIKVGTIKEITCIHDNLTFKQDLKSAFRYGTGAKLAARKGLHKKCPTANWNLIIPCFKKYFLSGIYSVIWNIVYCAGYYLT